MKTLHEVSLSRMSNLEFGQHVKSARTGIIASSTITDAILQNYLTTTDTSSIAYDRAMVQVTKNDETVKITVADARRDLAVRAFLRYVTVFELSEDHGELDAFASINTLCKKYSDMINWNFEKETNGITNLVDELEEGKYIQHIAKIGAGAYVTRMKNANNDFKILFDGRSQERSEKEVFDMKKLKATLNTDYLGMTTYILAMSNATDDLQFSKALTALNVVRKYYADMLAQRKPAKKGEQQDPIPEMK